MTTITPMRSFGTKTIFILLLAVISWSNSVQAQFSRSKNKSSNEYRNGYQRMAAGSNFNFEIRGGELWAWGNNGTGKLGDGTTTNRLSPVKIGTDNDWVSVSCGELHSVALKANGTIWTWGYNNDGQLGNGTSSFTLRLSPGQVGSATDWVSISAGGYHTTAIKANGTLWVWGQGGNGQLGDGGSGANYHINTPFQIGTGTDWVILSAGYAHTLAIKANGSLWGWGYNAYGMVGDNSGIFTITTPSQVGSDVDWVSISAGQNQSHGIKSNGTLWGWGYNGNGQLGDGSTTQRNSPTRVGTLSNWVSVTSGYKDALGVQANGELWGWGYNNYGQLGDGTTAQRTSPVLLGTGYVNVCAGSYSYHSIALKANGTLWACGWNQAGQLGDGTTADQINRIQVSATTNWLSVAGGYYYTHAIKSNGTL